MARAYWRGFPLTKIPTVPNQKVVASGKSWLTGQNSSEKVQMRCWEKNVLYSVTWEEDSQNISLKEEIMMSAPFPQIPEYLRKIFWYRLYTRRFFLLPELDRQGQRSLFHTENLLVRILFASSSYGEFHFLNFSKNIYGLGRMFH